MILPRSMPSTAGATTMIQAVRSPSDPVRSMPGSRILIALEHVAANFPGCSRLRDDVSSTASPAAPNSSSRVCASSKCPRLSLRAWTGMHANAMNTQALADEVSHAHGMAGWGDAHSHNYFSRSSLIKFGM